MNNRYDRHNRASGTPGQPGGMHRTSNGARLTKPRLENDDRPSLRVAFAGRESPRSGLVRLLANPSYGLELMRADIGRMSAVARRPARVGVSDVCRTEARK
jgi:hypothetical protein